MALTRDDLQHDVLDTYVSLRVAIATVALALPTTLLVWGALDDRIGHQESLSAFYYTPARSVFTGALVAVGALLIVYRGYSRGENLLLDVAGLFAALVGVIPTNPPGRGCHLGDSCVLHLMSAGAFFLAAAVAIVLFSGTTLILAPPRDAMMYRAVYLALSAGIVATVMLYVVLRDRVELVWWETIGIYLFGTYWAVKTVEIARYDTERRVMTTPG